MVEITITTVRRFTVREHRERLGLTQADFAYGAGVSRGSVNKIETGRGPYGINFEVADRISKFIGIPMDEVAWPFSISDAGRPAGTGKSCNKSRTILEATCPIHHITLPNTGICGDCE